MGVIDKLRGLDKAQTLVRDVTTDRHQEMPDKDSMRHVANYTYDEDEVSKMMDLICSRLNDKGRHWLRIEKSLILLNYLVQYGSLSVIEWYQKNALLIQALAEYHQQDNGKDIAGNIRKYSGQIVQLMNNKLELEHVREASAKELEEENKREKYMRRLERQKELQENYVDLVKTGARMNFFWF